MTLTHCLNTLGLKAAAAGNIGTPLLEALDLIDELDYLVVEISSFQAEHIRRSPHTVIFLNIFGDHLDRHGDKEGYFAAKQNLWAHQFSDDHLITPVSNKKSNLVLPSRDSVIFSSKLNHKDYPLDSILNADHFRQNLGVIPEVLKALNIKFTIPKLRKALQSSPLPAHRLELVAEVKGIKFYDDAIAVNPTATMAAVRHFGRDLGVLILGGKSSGDDPTEMIRFVEEVAPHVKIIITQSELSREIKPINTSLHIAEVKTLTDAVNLATQYPLPTTKVVLLSPAAKSYDQYSNFEAKGDEFKTLIRSKDSAKI